MTTKQNHLMQIVVIYLVIAISGWLSYTYIKFDNAIVTYLVADIVMTLVCFIFSLLKKNSSVYDAFWSVIPFYFVVHWAYLLYPVLQMEHWLIFAGVSFWSWRLTLNWARSWDGFAHEDWRYIDLSKASGKWYPAVNFSGIHLFPTLMVFGCMWPLFYVFQPTPDSSIVLYLGIIITFLGGFIELVADNQLYQFRNRDHKQKGDILSTGLWGVVRYPNYLGEMTFWLGVAIIGMAYDAPYYVYCGIIGLVLMFVFVSIPMKEKRMAERRNDYASYQKKVPMLIPFIKSK